MLIPAVRKKILEVFLREPFKEIHLSPSSAELGIFRLISLI